MYIRHRYINIGGHDEQKLIANDPAFYIELTFYMPDVNGSSDFVVHLLGCLQRWLQILERQSKRAELDSLISKSFDSLATQTPRADRSEEGATIPFEEGVAIPPLPQDNRVNTALDRFALQSPAFVPWGDWSDKEMLRQSCKLEEIIRPF
tara:strand:- start:3789 stop:4238 length:450 start_codon:yes stop_codon:yes gene_type:complete